MSEDGIRRYSDAELTRMRADGQSQTDLERVNAMTEEELERDIASDADWKHVPRNWYEDAVMVVPAAKKLLSLRLDPDVVAWFREQGPGCQTRMNAVLRAYVERRRKG